jgi:hypothetical protein
VLFWSVTTITYAQNLATPLSRILNDDTNRYAYGNGRATRTLFMPNGLPMPRSCRARPAMATAM